MLTLRPEQMEQFREAAVKRFERKMLSHLLKFFPKECRLLTEPDLHQMIRQGIAKAKTYGITAERDVCLYLDVMLVLGRDFDRDPKLSWVHSILTRRSLASVSARVERLYDLALESQSS